MHGLLIPVPFYFFPWYYLTYFETTNFVPIVRTTSGAIFMSIEIDSLRKIMTEWSSGVRRKPRENISREKKKPWRNETAAAEHTHTHDDAKEKPQQQTASFPATLNECFLCTHLNNNKFHVCLIIYLSTLKNEEMNKIEMTQFQPFWLCDQFVIQISKFQSIF